MTQVGFGFIPSVTFGLRLKSITLEKALCVIKVEGIHVRSKEGTL